MCIPRERIENGKYLTRLYTQMESNVASPSSAFTNSNDPEEMKKSYERALAQRREVTLPRIFDQVAKTLKPFKLEVEKVDWWGELPGCTVLIGVGEDADSKQVRIKLVNASAASSS